MADQTEQLRSPCSDRQSEPLDVLIISDVFVFIVKIDCPFASFSEAPTLNVAATRFGLKDCDIFNK